MKILNLCLILFCILIGLAAEEVIDGSPIRFSLLKALDYEVNLTTGTSIGRLYVSVNYELSQSDLLNTDYYSFFLNSNAIIEHVKLNGVETRYNITTNLHPKHFIPELIQPELIEEDSEVNCYSFDAALFEDLPQNVAVTLEYWLPLPAYSLQEDGREAIMIGTIPFFYPRNIIESSNVNVNIITPIFHGIDSAINTQDTGGIRRIYSNFVDIPQETIKLDIYKLN